MKGIMTVAFLSVMILLVVLSYPLQSYAGQASATASIIIIIPAKETTPQTEVADEKPQKEGVCEKEQEQLYAQNENKE